MENRVVIFIEELYTVSGDQVFGRYNWLVYAAEISKHFDKATIFVTARFPTGSSHKPALPKVIDLADSNIRLVKLPAYDSLISSLICSPWVAWKFLKNLEVLRQAQVFLIRMPTICGLMLGELARVLGKKVCFYVAGNIERSAVPVVKGGRGRILWRWLARTVKVLNKIGVRGATVFTVGQEMAKEFGEGLPIIPRPREVINVANPMYRAGSLYARQDSCQGEAIVLLRVCQLYPSKGLEVLLESVRILLEKGLKVELKVVGMGAPDYYQQLLHLTEDLGLAAQVEFLGALAHDRVMEWYRRADIHVVSSWGEGVPRVIMEAWAASLPLVTTGVGGIPGLVIEAENGLLVPPGDAAALAGAIERVIMDQGLRQKLISHGFALARGNSLEKQAQKIAAIIKMHSSGG